MNLDDFESWLIDRLQFVKDNADAFQEIRCVLDHLRANRAAIEAGCRPVLKIIINDESYFEENACCTVPSFASYLDVKGGHWCIHTVEACLDAKEKCIAFTKRWLDDIGLTATFEEEENEDI